MEDVGMVYGTDLYLTTKALVPIVASGQATLQIVETSGSSPERTQNSVIVPGYLRLAAQFMARSSSYPVAKVKAQLAYGAIVGIRNCWIINSGMTASGWYREITPLQEPFDAGPDDRGTARCGFNVIAIRRP